MQGDETAQDLHRSIIKSASNSEGEWLFVSTQSIKCSKLWEATLGPTDISVHSKLSYNDKHSDHQGNTRNKANIGMCPIHTVCYYCYAVDIYGIWSHDLVGLAQKGILNTAGPSERSFSHRSFTLGDRGQSQSKTRYSLGCLKMPPFNLAASKTEFRIEPLHFTKLLHTYNACAHISHTHQSCSLGHNVSFSKTSMWFVVSFSELF